MKTQMIVAENGEWTIKTRAPKNGEWKTKIKTKALIQTTKK